MGYKDFFMVLSSLIAVLGSFITAKITARSEFKKLTVQQNHELKVDAIQAFSKLQNAVNAYVSTPILKYQREALSAIGEFNPYASENILIICNSLREAIANNRLRDTSDFLNRLSSEWSITNPKKKNNK